MYEEKYSRTWETLLVPDSKSWNKYSFSWKNKDGVRISSLGKIPALIWNDNAYQRAINMEHKRKKKVSTRKISGKLNQQ